MQAGMEVPESLIPHLQTWVQELRDRSYLYLMKEASALGSLYPGNLGDI